MNTIASGHKNPRLLLLVMASATLDLDLIQCRGFGIGMPEAPPPDIQLFPPGRHQITAKTGDGKPITLNTDINEQVANSIRASFADIMKDALSGAGPKPFLDFNHQDAEASAWVTDVYWAGQDPVKGGVRAKVEWTEPGMKAISGKTYRQFSPNFLVDKASSQIVGTTVNMGGLVNRPAFKTIQHLFASDGTKVGEDKKQEKSMITKLQIALIQAGLLTSAEQSDDAAAAEFVQAFNKVKAKAADTDGLLVKAMADVQTAQKSLKDRDAAFEVLAKANAETAVAGAIAAGKIAPKDDAAKAKWVTLIAKDASNVELLNAIEPKQDVTKKVITTKAKDGTKEKEAATQPEAHEFLVKSREWAEKQKKSEAEGMAAVASSEPALYDQYRESLLFVTQ